VADETSSDGGVVLCVAGLDVHQASIVGVSPAAPVRRPSGGEYEELGGDYFVRRDSERLKQKYVRGLKELGYGVELHERATAA
jgi:hypothetical protein